MRRAITWVYCDPKSRMMIFECLGGAEIFTALVMRLRNPVFARRIVSLAFPWTDCPLPGHATLKLIPDLGRFALLQRIDTATQHQRDGASNRQGLHSCILGSKPVNARRYGRKSWI